jgi:hypothetical protein
LSLSVPFFNVQEDSMSKSSTPKVHRSKLEWQEIFKKYESSGASAVRFCESEGLPLSSFNNWRKKLYREEPLQSFVELPLVSNVEAKVELCFPNGLLLKIC